MALIPFVSSLQPSARAKSLAFEPIPIADVGSGEFKFADSGPRGEVIVVYLSPEMKTGLRQMEQAYDVLPAFDSADIPTMQLYFRGSTKLGCYVKHAPPGFFGDDWQGGWWDYCHWGAWDYAGRFVPEVNGYSDQRLENLIRPPSVEWQDEVAILRWYDPDIR